VKAILSALFLSFALSLNAKEPIRTWTSSDGRTLEARYLEMVGTKVRIENTSGRKFTVPLTGFSSADQEYVKKAHGRSLFAEPQPFEDEGRGGVIVASAKGKVQVVPKINDRYADKDPDPRAVIVGESIGPGATLITGSGAEADLLLTNGTLAHLGANTKLVLTALYQKAFKGTNHKASELTKEVSPSRTALKLEQGDLVLEVRKLGKESSFLVETKIAQAGIRGTQFKVSASADSAELSVLEGQVDFLDAEQLATSVETAQKAGTRKGVPAKLEDMSASEQAEVKQAVEQVKGASASIDLNRLANTVDGYEKKPNYIVKSALGMELIWCPPGGFVMGVGIDSEKHPQRKVILTKGFYLGKFEVTQEQYEKVVGYNPSKFKNKFFPVEQVSWRNANAFCSLLNRREKKKKNWSFSLPTEAEFEYASQGGLSLRQSIKKSNDPKFGNCRQSNLGKTTKVGNYPANNYGFFDLFGNVWEMCSDRFSSYTSSTVIDPKGPNRASGQLVLRGGSFCNWGAHGQSSWKASTSEEYKHACIGFRVAFKQAD
jgi:formylglycine-generating enzyme required for sulfatase activity